jgi:sulfur-oxidizing protein SoxX
MFNKVTVLMMPTGFLATGCVSAQNTSSSDIDSLANKYLAQSYLPGPGQELDRIKQDETQKVCSKYRNNLPVTLDKELIEREQKNIKYPASGKMMGDWKEGEKYFKALFRGAIGSFEPDRPGMDRGGNCYACHAGDRKEVAFGNMGPSLSEYGKLRGHVDAIVKYTYEKIYNPQAFVACSNMPRLGHGGHLTPEKIADITAYLVSPESPLNK